MLARLQCHEFCLNVSCVVLYCKPTFRLPRKWLPSFLPHNSLVTKMGSPFLLTRLQPDEAPSPSSTCLRIGRTVRAVWACPQCEDAQRVLHGGTDHRTQADAWPLRTGPPSGRTGARRQDRAVQVRPPLASLQQHRHHFSAQHCWQKGVFEKSVPPPPSDWYRSVLAHSATHPPCHASLHTHRPTQSHPLTNPSTHPPIQLPPPPPPITHHPPPGCPVCPRPEAD